MFILKIMYNMEYTTATEGKNNPSSIETLYVGYFRWKICQSWEEICSKVLSSEVSFAFNIFLLWSASWDTHSDYPQPMIGRYLFVVLGSVEFCSTMMTAITMRMNILHKKYQAYSEVILEGHVT